ncbi:DUF2637 domain-containing protein [Streptomyces sp. DT195]|uniref:DUF2637 domain-containing protein n=1 Tax=Streptomyces sp. DT195 TaxID=3393419 RepID=UPI003CF59BBA
MSSITPPTATPSLRERIRCRSLWCDRVVIIALGVAGAVLSFNALRQVAVAIHTAPGLSFLFPIVIDGFIAYGVRALLVLRDAPLGPRLYVWTLFGAATIASLWANSLHSVRLNQPGAHILILGDATVAILSAIAPLALGGATHLHILVTRHASRGEQAEPHVPADTAAAGTPAVIPADASAIPAARLDATHGDAQPQLPATSAVPTAEPAETGEPAAAANPDTDGRRSTELGEGTGHRDADDSGQEHETPRVGRRAEASIDRLAEIIAQAHPGSGQLTRAMARSAIAAQGLSAGNDRIAEALGQLRRDEEARPHPRID